MVGQRIVAVGKFVELVEMKIVVVVEDVVVDWSNFL